MNGCKSIMVVVDHFSKYLVFMAAPGACPAEEVAKLFHNHTAKYFGLPEDIVIDRDTCLTGRFWTALFNLKGSKLSFCTASHPQTNGQKERINFYLRSICVTV